MFFDSISGINSYLVICCIASFHTKVEIFQINIKIGMNKTVFDFLPDDAGHFIPIHLNNRIFNLDFCHDIPRVNGRSVLTRRIRPLMVRASKDWRALFTHLRSDTQELLKHISSQLSLFTSLPYRIEKSSYRRGGRMFSIISARS